MVKLVLQSAVSIFFIPCAFSAVVTQYATQYHILLQNSKIHKSPRTVGFTSGLHSAIYQLHSRLTERISGSGSRGEELQTLSGYSNPIVIFYIRINCEGL